MTRFLEEFRGPRAIVHRQSKRPVKWGDRTPYRRNAPQRQRGAIATASGRVCVNFRKRAAARLTASAFARHCLRAGGYSLMIGPFQKQSDLLAERSASDFL